VTITTKIFGNLQTGVPRADDLRVRTPINAALQWLGEGLPEELNTHFSAVSTSISAALVAFRGTPNTWSAVQTFTAAPAVNVTATTALTMTQTEDGAAAGPTCTLFRNSASPAAADQLGSLSYAYKDDAGNTEIGIRLLGSIIDPANVSEDVEFVVQTQVAGALGNRMTVANGVQIGTPTGGYQGVGTLNMDNAIFRDGTQVVSTRVTGWGDPFGAISRATFSTTTATANQVAEALAALITDLKAHGLIGT
jgi:hypothetical protein